MVQEQIKKGDWVRYMDDSPFKVSENETPEKIAFMNADSSYEKVTGVAQEQTRKGELNLELLSDLIENYIRVKPIYHYGLSPVDLADHLLASIKTKAAKDMPEPTLVSHETIKGDGWECLESYPYEYDQSFIEHVLEQQDAFRDKEVAQLREEIAEITRYKELYMEGYREHKADAAYWKERCEAAERLINVSFSQNNFEEWDNWRRLKNQNQQ